MRPALEYASSVWSPLASSTSINKLQVMQNAALRTATGCTQDTNIQHLHDETLTLPMHEHLQLHASQYKQKHNMMTNSLRTKITNKNKLGIQALRNPTNKELNKTYKTSRNEIISELRNTEIKCYSNELELHKNDLSKSWKILRSIIGKDSNNSTKKLSFNINNTVVTDSEVIANEFNNFFVSIGPTLASNITCSKDPLAYVNGIVNSIVVHNVTSMDIRTVISSLKIVAQDLMVSHLL